MNVFIDYRIENPPANQQEERKQSLLQEIEIEKVKINHKQKEKQPKVDFPAELKIDANIKNVYYGQTNAVGAKLIFDNYDLCDTAVVIELMNGKWICWQWVEQGSYGPAFRVSYSEENPMWEDRFTVFSEVSASQNWQSMITQRLLSLELKKRHYPSGESYLTDMVLHFSYGELTIRGVAEPGPEASLTDIDFAPDWTAIVFDTAILKADQQSLFS
ncbi:MAG: hypothetical protein AAFN10_06845, partial [Bacteroidota bacterium]